MRCAAGHAVTGILPILAACVFAGAAAAAPSVRPNILLIYTDDQSHRTVGCYPEAPDWVETPHIDALARRGIRFSHAYTGTWCAPARMTLLTGRLQFGNESMGGGVRSSYDPAR
ncbi:MAG: sulfatase-like hydrolase/transferase, partial [Opitutaceae bacterium]|nr:sulfatase-like hydrolase/transferase [Opitutaceae bacterium]